MQLLTAASWLLFASAILSAGCGQTPSPALIQSANLHSVATAPIQQPIVPTPQSAKAPVSPKLEAFEERKGPFTFSGQIFTVVLRSLRIPGKRSDFSEALSSLDIIDAGDVVQHHETFPHPIENGDFSESCSASVNQLRGSNGSGLLIDTGCLPSAPLSGGPWRIFGVINGKFAPVGKPLYATGEMGDFIPGKISKIGNLTQILADELRIRLFTGYFFVSVPVRVNWREGKLELAQHCMYQTGHGFVEGGCEMQVEGLERVHLDQEITFVRMFTESNEQIGPPAHIVVKKESNVEVLAAKVFVTLNEGKDSLSLDVGEDIWVKVRIDGKEGWIHTAEDLQAIGLYQSG